MGDLLLSWTDEMFQASGLPAEATERGHRVLSVMRTEVMAGQYLDLLEQVSGAGTVESALRVASFKSAKYTVERPLHLGAALADAPDDVVSAYTGYGLPLGTAFQLRDDVLGMFGDPAQTGKPAGDDLREGKRTVLVAVAFAKASPAQGRHSPGGSGTPARSGGGGRGSGDHPRHGRAAGVRGTDQAAPVRGAGGPDRRSGHCRRQGSAR